MSDHRHDADENAPDETGTDQESFDVTASELLEARLESRQGEVPDAAVEAHSALMGSVRAALSDDFDGPSEARLDAMVRKALRSGDEGVSESVDGPSPPISSVVPLSASGGGRRRTTRWVIGAGAALLVVVVGFGVVRTSGGTDGDVASPGATQAESADAGGADSGEPSASDSAEPVPPEFGSSSEQDEGSAAVGESRADSDTGVASGGATGTPDDDASFEAATPTSGPGGLEFTIVVPIAGP